MRKPIKLRINGFFLGCLFNKLTSERKGVEDERIEMGCENSKLDYGETAPFT